MTAARPLGERFHEKVRKGAPDECWEWTGYVGRGGYGQFSIGSRKARTLRTVSAHRVAYELANGPISDGMHVLHACDNRRCVNPAHLFLGSAAENTADMFGKGRAPDQTGQRNHGAKLSDAEVAAIKALKGAMPQAAIGDRFGVSQQQVSNIFRGESRVSEELAP